MSRSGYSDDCENIGMYRGVVASATRGKRGQAFFRDLVSALDELTAKRLVSSELQTADGEVCAPGALGRRRGHDLGELVNAGRLTLGEVFGIAKQLAAETMYENDEAGPYQGETPEERWTRVRAWAAEQIIPTVEEVPEVSE